MRLLYAFHPDKPTHGTSVRYHGFEFRGTKSVSLLSSSLPPHIPEDENVKYIDLRNRNVSIHVMEYLQYVFAVCRCLDIFYICFTMAKEIN